MAAFPGSTLPLRVEMLLGDAWVDVTGDRRESAPVRINRGTANGATRADPSTCSLTLANDGRYSPRNPTGPHYGLLGRNTQMRVIAGREVMGAAHAEEFGTATHAAPTLDAYTQPMLLISLWGARSGPPGTFNLTLPGSMTIGTETDGSHSTARAGYRAITSTGYTPLLSATASAAPFIWVSESVLVPGGTVQEQLSGVRSSGSSSDVTLTTSSGTQASWWLIALQIDWSADPAGPGDDWMPIKIGAAVGAWLKRAVGGAEAVTFSASSATDLHARVYVVAAGDDLLPTSIASRFYGELASLPPKWDLSGTDVTVEVEAAGIMRRLEQGSTPLRSPMTRAGLYEARSFAVTGLWPCEDGTDARILGSALTGGAPLAIVGDIDVASDDSVPGSEAIPVLSATSYLSAPVAAHGLTSELAARALITVPSGGLTDGARILDLHQTGGGTLTRWSLFYHAGGGLSLQGFNAAGVQLCTSGGFAFAINDKRLLVAIGLKASGSDVDWIISTLKVTGTGLIDESQTGTFASRAVGVGTTIVVSPAGGLDGMGVGHLITGPDYSLALSAVQWEAITGHRGETAGNRIARLCGEEDIPLDVIGNVFDTPPAGVQRAATLLDLLDDMAEVDGGVLYEPRTMLGLAYRTRADLYNQAPKLQLGYGQRGESAPGLEPVEDDSGVRNDITVTRDGGASVRLVRETGPLSVLPPPAGVGRYDEQITLNLYDDSQLAARAGWRLHLGTWDELRYPVIPVSIRNLGNAGKHDLVWRAARMDVRDRLTISDPPPWLPPEDIDQLAEGIEESLGLYEWELSYQCTPGRPWDVAVVGSYRLGSDSSTLLGGIGTTTTSLSVAVATGPLWSTTSEPWDVVIGGERMTVTAVTGTSSPQTWTVVRSVNGVVKSHSSGAEVRLYHPGVLA